MHVIEGQMFVSAIVQKPVFALTKIKVNIFSTQYRLYKFICRQFSIF